MVLTFNLMHAQSLTLIPLYSISIHSFYCSFRFLNQYRPSFQLLFSFGFQTIAVPPTRFSFLPEKLSFLLGGRALSPACLFEVRPDPPLKIAVRPKFLVSKVIVGGMTVEAPSAIDGIRFEDSFLLEGSYLSVFCFEVIMSML